MAKKLLMRAQIPVGWTVYFYRPSKSLLWMQMSIELTLNCETLPAAEAICLAPAATIVTRDWPLVGCEKTATV